MKLTFQQFSGIAPRIAPRLLPATLAQEALDVKLWSGELRPHYADEILQYIPSNIQSIYRYKWKNKKYNWLMWPYETRVAKGPVYDDENNRIYFMNQGGFFVTDSSLLEDRDYTNGLDERGTPYYTAGIPRAGYNIMSVSGSGSGDIEARSYIVCYVRQWPDGTIDVGKSSEPYATSWDAAARRTIDVRPGQTVKIAVSNISDTDIAKTGVNKVYIYRSEVTSSGQALYSYVDQFDINPSHVTNNPNATWNTGGWYEYLDKKQTHSLVKLVLLFTGTHQ